MRVVRAPGLAEGEIVHPVTPRVPAGLEVTSHGLIRSKRAESGPPWGLRPSAPAPPDSTPHGAHDRDEASSGPSVSLRVPVHSMSHPAAEGPCVLT